MAHSFENLLAQGVVPSAESSTAARRIGVVHSVCGTAARELAGAILESGVLSNERINPASSTAECERRLGWPPMVYFYAGRVHPRIPQEMALVFGGFADLDGGVFEDGRRGGVTPFDSGGVAASNSRLPWSRHGGSEREYVEAHNLRDLNRWRDYFALFLEEYFDRPRDYWDRCPCRPIDGAQLVRQGESQEHPWMDWTFELHLEDPVTITSAGVVYLTASLAEYIQQNAMKFPLVATLSSRLNPVAHPRQLREACESGIRLACGAG